MGGRPLAAAAATILGLTGIAVGVARGPVGPRPWPMLDHTADVVTARERSVVPPRLNRAPTAASATAPPPIVPPQEPRFHRSDGATTQPLEPDAPPAAIPPAQRLPAGDAEELRRSATALLTADLTGIGRHQFPGRWGHDPPAHHPCCEAVTIHRATPGRHPTRKELAVVLVTWSGVRRSTGARIAETVTPATFAREAGGWRPVPVEDLS